MRLAFLVPLGFAAGAITCRLLLLHALTTFAVDRAQPLAVVTYWGSFGLTMWLALFVAIVIASVGYIACLTSPRLASVPDAARGRSTTLTMTTRSITICSALACGAALFFPVVFSSDVYAYAGYGLIALHGLNPYAHAVVTLRGPLMDAVLWQWGNPPPVCVYGPAFVWFAQAIVAIFGGFGPAAPLWALRVGACGALVLCAPLAYAAFPERTRAAASAGIALNPIAIWAAAEGHNDVYLVAIVLAGFALIVRGRPLTGAVVVALSALVKALGLLAAAAAPLMFAASRSRSRVLAGSLVGLGAAALIAWPALLQLSRNAGHGGYFPQFSLQYVLNATFGVSAAIALAVTLAAALAIGGCVLLWKENRSGFALLALALWIAIPNPYPWYALWILPAALLAWDTPAAWTIVTLALSSVLRYLPDATTDLSTPSSVAIALLPFAIAAAVFIACSRRLRSALPESRRTAPDSALYRFP
jgi:alpha-1,6-mannosyltransferase